MSGIVTPPKAWIVTSPISGIPRIISVVRHRVIIGREIPWAV
jgi:hypothetical protein